MPERFQEVSEEFDVIFTVEERIYDTVLAGIQHTTSKHSRPMIVCRNSYSIEF